MVNRRSIVLFALPLLFTLGFTFEQPLSLPSERAALLELRSSLGLRRNEWPIKAEPCLNWTGVQCENGRVVGINISGFKRTQIGRENPKFALNALANLTLLVSFNSSKFSLPGSIPDWFGQRLVSLQVLDLRSCSVTGPIPTSIGNFTNMTGLFLSDNGLSGTIPASLGQLLRLSVLDLSYNKLTGSIPSTFVAFGNLSILDLSSNYLSGSIPQGIGALLKLQYLNLSNNSLSSSIPSQFGDLLSLVDLDLSFNSLSGSVPPNLVGLKNLRRMAIGNNFFGGSLPENFFASLSRLQSVILSHNGFTGALPHVIWSMPGLLFLDVSGNNFTGLLPNSSSSYATSAVLNISQNMFYGSLSPIVGMLNFINLSKNYFEGRLPENVQINASIDSNCLQNVLNQKTLAECTSFYVERGLTFENLKLPNPTQSTGAGNSGKSNNNGTILARVLSGVVFILILVSLIFLLLFSVCKRGSTNHRGVCVHPIIAGESPPPPEAFLNFSSLGDAYTYKQLLLATSDFNEANLIKKGHSGDLFLGILENGTPIVIKRIDLQSISKEKHLMELDFFSRVSHTRLLPFLGYCLENENLKFMVYKYMPNGDLSTSLDKKVNPDDGSLQSLDWITRLKIATETAEGLAYLHHECTPPIVHRDVQASSILLGDTFEVRLGSLSEACAQDGDAHENRITRLLRFPQSSEEVTSGSSTATCSYDTYCFGKVLLELVTGKLGISASSDTEVKEWLDQTLPYISIYDKDLVTKIVDPSLIVHDDLLEEVWAMAVVAQSCLNANPSRRPLMRYILKALENPLKVVWEENAGSAGSARLRTTSSRGSWNAFFGSWRSLSDVAGIPASSANKMERAGSLGHLGTTGSNGSAPNGGSDHPGLHRPHSQDIIPEPSDIQNL